MNKSAIKNATTQELIEWLMGNECRMIHRNGTRIKGLLNESRSFAKELGNRGIIDYDSFIKNKDLEEIK